MKQPIANVGPLDPIFSKSKGSATGEGEACIISLPL